MINIGGNPLMIILAIVAALGGVGLYFVRNFRPELARDHDIFFSAIALVYGIILLSFNFRMEITTQLAQVLVVGFAGWFAVEALILRQALSTQARRAPMNPIADDPIGSPDYRAEIDNYREIPSRRSNSSTRRMGGTGPSQSRPTELRGDTNVDRGSDRNTDRYTDQNTSKRRPRRNPDNRNDTVIDIDEDDIRPISPKQRRPRPNSESGSGSNGSSSERDRPARNRDSSVNPTRDNSNIRDSRNNENRGKDSSREQFDDWSDNPPPKRRRPRPEVTPEIEDNEQYDY